MKISKKQLAHLFDIWAQRYAEDPESFGQIIDESGNLILDYGDQCAEYFTKLYKEIFQENT